MTRLYPPAERLARYVGALSGWRRLLAAILAGVLAAAALPPLYVLPALWIAFPVLFWLIDAAARARDAALVGWGFGFGYFLAGLHWISYSLLVDGDKFAWMIPFALLLIPAFIALFTALSLIHISSPRD